MTRQIYMIFNGVYKQQDSVRKQLKQDIMLNFRDAKCHVYVHFDHRTPNLIRGSCNLGCIT
jgi:hypothetical protein